MINLLDKIYSSLDDLDLDELCVSEISKRGNLTLVSLDLQKVNEKYPVFTADDVFALVGAKLPSGVRFIDKKAAMSKSGSFTAYHGSNNPDIEALEANDPDLQHGGDLGYGVYVSENFATANSYGPYVYKLELNFDRGQIFDLSAENQDQVEGEEGNSILVGEYIPPFYFLLNNTKYLVTNADFDTGAVNTAKARLLTNIGNLFSPLGVDVSAALSVLEQKEGLPDIYDVQETLGWEEQLSDEQLDAATEDINQYIAEADNWVEENSALILGLDEIGQEVRAAGYKALYFERAGTVGDEILVFDESDIKIVEKIDPGKKASSDPCKKSGEELPTLGKQMQKHAHTLSEDEAKELGKVIGIDWENVKFTPEDLQMGFDVELEHGLKDTETNVTDDDVETTAKIAWAHLKEMPDYYKRLKKMEDGQKKEAHVLARAQVDAYGQLATIVTDLATRLKKEKNPQVREYIQSLLNESEPLLQRVFEGTSTQKDVDDFLSQYKYLQSGGVPDVKALDDLPIDVEISSIEDLFPYFNLLQENLRAEKETLEDVHKQKDVEHLLRLLGPILDQTGAVVTWPYVDEIDWDLIEKFNDEYTKYLDNIPLGRDIMRDEPSFKQFLHENVENLTGWTAFEDLLSELGYTKQSKTAGGPFEQWLEPSEPNPEGAERTPVSGKKEKPKKKERAKEDPESMVSLQVMTTTPTEEYQYAVHSTLLDDIVKNGFDENSVKQVSDLMGQLGFEKEDVDSVAQSLSESVTKNLNKQKNTVNPTQSNPSTN